MLVSKKSRDRHGARWVYLDIGKFGGLAETMDESIRYPIRTPRDGDETGACVLAGPTCDSMDVMYEKEPYLLPVSLEIGDKVLIEGTGAYTTTYSAVAFTGYSPHQSCAHLTPRARAACPEADAPAAVWVRAYALDMRLECAEECHDRHPFRAASTGRRGARGRCSMPPESVRSALHQAVAAAA